MGWLKSSRDSRAAVIEILAIAMSAGFILALTRKRAENRSFTDQLVQRTMALHGAA